MEGRRRPASRSVISIVAFTAVVSLQAVDAARIIVVPPAPGLNVTVAPGDFDGDGRVDLAVKHDSNGDWTIDFAADGLGFWDDVAAGFGGSDFVPAPADYDGDGKTDFSTKDVRGIWYIDFAADGLGEGEWDAILHGYGTEGAHPVPADYDGDGKADLSVKTDWGTWHIDFSANGFGTSDRNLAGLGGAESQAAPADYDGDGKADLAIYNATNSTWFIDYAANGFTLPGRWDSGWDGPLNLPNAHPVPADYDGDKRADIAVKTDNGDWRIDFAANGFGSWNRSFVGYGPAYFRAVPADYDGDGKADFVMRDDDGVWYVDYAANGIVDWELIWNPDIVRLSPGDTVSPYDVRVFDAQWMKPWDRNNSDGGVGWTNYAVQTSFEGGVWATSDRMAAMARMYELTRAPRYLDHLNELGQIVLKWRDDRRPDSDSRRDGLRNNRLMASWGATTVSYGNYHSSSIVVAGMYVHPIATFARIVAESPHLHAAYGDDARDAATAVLETMLAFLPELKTDCCFSDRMENYFVNPTKYRTLLTTTRCKQAYDAAVADLGPNPDPDDVAALAKQKTDCNNRRLVGGLAMAHNENHAMVMAMIELSRALDTDFYRAGLTAERAAYIREVARTTIPRIVARAQRYFANNWRLKGTGTKVSYVWDYADIDFRRHLEDPSHGAVSMGYVRLLVRDQARLSGLASAAGESLVLTGENLRRLTNTFVFVVGRATNLAKNVGGGVADPVDRYNVNCDGWLMLSQFDKRVYDKCASVLLRGTTGWNRPAQPYLWITNHAALLDMKHYSSP